MREPVNAERIVELMRALGREAAVECRVYFTGGATAVLYGWRHSTKDVDLKLVPDRDDVLRAFPRLKETLRINLETASPSDFIPSVPCWEARSLFIRREGCISFFHFDPVSQALAKLERGHALDLQDVRNFVRLGLVSPSRLLSAFGEIEPHLYRFPAVDPPTFRRAVEEFVASV